MNRTDDLGERDWESLIDTPDAGPARQWLVGVGLAALVAACALYCFWAGRAIVPAGSTRHPDQNLRQVVWVKVEGLGAISTGFLLLSIAAFIHLHWFWTASPRFWGYRGENGATFL